MSRTQTYSNVWEAASLAVSTKKPSNSQHGRRLVRLIDQTVEDFSEGPFIHTFSTAPHLMFVSE